MNKKIIFNFVVSFSLLSVFASGQLDLALSIRLAPEQTNIVSPGDNVTFQIEVRNQGTVSVLELGLYDYVPYGLILNDPNWFINDSGAEVLLKTNPSPFLPGAKFYFDINFTAAATTSTTTITNAAEIAVVKLIDGTIVYNDIDSTFDFNNINDGTPVDNAMDNPTDEDDHDIETITIIFQNNTNVYPGDLNHDGIVNHIDLGLFRTVQN